jgi:hypothetical protein
MTKPLITFLFCFATTAITFASDLRISNEMLFVEGSRDNRTMYAILDVSWKNAWKNDTNHDAVWLFCKFVMGENGYRHISLRQTGHEVVRNAQAPGLQVRLDVAVWRMVGREPDGGVWEQVGAAGVT